MVAVRSVIFRSGESLASATIDDRREKVAGPGQPPQRIGRQPRSPQNHPDKNADIQLMRSDSNASRFHSSIQDPCPSAKGVWLCKLKKSKSVVKLSRSRPLPMRHDGSLMAAGVALDPRYIQPRVLQKRRDFARLPRARFEQRNAL